MALTGIGYARAKRRQQIFIATASVGPGATNMVTAAAVAMSNRLPILFLPGDTFANRMPDPVLQQVENFNNPGILRILRYDKPRIHCNAVTTYTCTGLKNIHTRMMVCQLN